MHAGIPGLKYVGERSWSVPNGVKLGSLKMWPLSKRGARKYLPVAKMRPKRKPCLSLLCSLSGKLCHHHHHHHLSPCSKDCFHRHSPRGTRKSNLCYSSNPPPPPSPHGETQMKKWYWTVSRLAMPLDARKKQMKTFLRKSTLNCVPLRLSQVKFSMVKIYLNYIWKTTKKLHKRKKIIGHHERKSIEKKRRNPLKHPWGKWNYQIQDIMWIYIMQFKEIKDKVNAMVKGKPNWPAKEN